MAETTLEIAKRLNREFKNKNLAVMADVQPRYLRVPMNAMGFDFSLFGGIPEGRVIQFSGREASGKTTAACAMLAAYQRKYPDKRCVFVDVEHALDLEFISAMTGLDLTKLIYLNPENMDGGQILDCVHEFLTADDIGMVVLDSAAALITSDEYESDIENDMGMRGSIAKRLNVFFKKSMDKIAAKRSILLIINQVRVAGKARNGADILYEPCGSGLAFYSSVILRFGKRTFTQEDVVDKYDGEKADGIRLWFTIQKNKTASMQRGGGFITFRYDKGLDWMYDLIEVALKYEFIARPTLQTYSLINLEDGTVYKDRDGKELHIVGRNNVKKYFADNVDFQLEYLSMIHKHISALSNQYGKLLDDRKIIEINEDSIGNNYIDEEPKE